ncbi:hypothetical protein [Streptomyces sp. Ru72]|nr:hypothetical protein [Streptomyces sp. Ru72]
MHLAIDAALAPGREIKLAAKCSEPAERAYFEEDQVSSSTPSRRP